MVLPISMSVYEIQCGSLVHFCMVNSVIKKVDTNSIFDLGGFETGPYSKFSHKLAPFNLSPPSNPVFW